MAKIARFPIGISLQPGNKGLALVQHEDKCFEKPLSWEIAERAYNRTLEKSKGDIRLSYHPVKTASVNDIKGILEGWDKEGWVASVIVIDYAGNLAPVDPKANTVEQVATSWALMRQLSEIRSCLVVTAQQGNKEGFRSYCLTRNNFSESKLILAHVTSFIGINATDEERRSSIMRLNFVVRREEQFSESYCLHCAQYLDAAAPIVLSALPEWRGSQ
jgi:hypothetical protein